MKKVKKPQIIFVDIDWTIYNHKNGHEFDVESIEALKRCQEKGIKVFLCTARAYHSISQIKLLDIFVPDGMILCNGGIVLSGNDVIYEEKMDEELFEKLCEIVLTHKLTLEGIEPFSRFLIAPPNEAVRNVFDIYWEEMPLVEDYHHRHIISTLLFAGEEYDEILKKEIPSALSYFRFHPFGVDVVQTAHEKGDAIKYTLEYFGIKKDRSIAFGDDLGDLSMFDNVGISIAMANGKEVAKNHAMIVTDEVWNHGVKKGLELLKII